MSTVTHVMCSDAAAGPAIPPGDIPFSIRAACERVGMARQDLAGCVYHKMKTYFPHLTDAARKVVAVLLDHANVDNNRVWCSVATIADEAPGRGTEGGLATSTVEAVMDDLREAGAIRLLYGEELAEGDGPHTAADRGVKRRGRHPVNTYDLAGLFAFVPPILRRLLAGACKMLARIAAPPKPPTIQEQFQSVARKLPDSSSSTIPVSTRQGASAHERETLGENLGPPGKPPISGVEIAIAYENPEPPPNSERATTEQRTDPSNQAPGRSVPNPKNRGQNKSSTESAETGFRSDADKLSKSEWTAVQALRAVGLHPIRKPGGIYQDVPKEIVKTMTAGWAMELAEFYHWRDRRKEPVEAKVLYGVWQNWLRNDGEWPGMFRLELDAINRARSAVKIVKTHPERKAVTKPVTPAPVAAGSSASAFDLEGVPDGERDCLLRDAIAAVLDFPMYKTGGERRRERVRSEGWTHPGVRVEAQRILTGRIPESGSTEHGK